MTNAQIIFNESVNLMKAGMLKGTGEFVTVELEDGTREQLEIPEAIHTFARWKAYGRQVKKGEHAAFTAYIWKHTEKTVVIDGEEKVVTDFIRVKSFFFTAEQTEKAAPAKELASLPDDCKKEVKGSYTWISGNTRPIKEDLKAAGFRWSKKNSAWYRAA
jgi:hypothetical protein